LALFNPKNEQNPRNSFGQSEKSYAFDYLADDFRHSHPALSQAQSRTANENQA
jgi:hypothetical protein